MKVANFKFLKLFGLYNIKSDVYFKRSLNSKNVSLEYLLNYKKILNIIYEYHIHHRTIIFIGPPSVKRNNLFLMLLKNTIHYLIIEEMFKKSAFSKNPDLLPINRLDNFDTKILTKLPYKPDLIVFFNQDAQTNIIKQSRKLKIPIVSLAIDFDSNSKIKSVSAPVSKKNRNVATLLLYSLLKRPV